MSSQQVRHAIIAARQTIEVVFRPQQPLERGQVRIAVKQVGVCGSEVQHWSGDTNERIPSDIGHEFAGEVIEVGPGVDNVREGERVAAWVPSGRGFADEAVVEARHCFHVADTVRFPFAAEPLACVWNAVQKANVSDGGNVVVVGAGFMALVAVMLHRGHTRTLTVASRRGPARSLAEGIGADHGVDPRELHAAVEAITRGAGADVAYEFTGVQVGLDQAARIVRPGGKLVIGGFHQGPATTDNPVVYLEPGQRVLDLERINWMAIDIVNAVRFYDERVRAQGMARAMEFLNERIIDPDLLPRLRLTRDDVPNTLARVVSVIEKAGQAQNAVTVIVGARPGALLATRLIKAKLNPGALIVATRRREVRDLAKRLGASHAVDPSTLSGLVEQLTDGNGAHVAYDFTGTQDGLTHASRSVRMGGKLVLAAQHDEPPTAGGEWTLQPGERVLDLGPLNAQDIEIVNGHFRNERVILNGMANAVRLLTSGVVDPAPLMGPSFPLEQTAEAFRAAAEGVGKVVVTP